MTNLVPPEERMRSGGVPKDRILSLTDPKTVPVHEAGFIPEDQRVVGVTIGDESRAYPINVLTWHECANDTLDGVPIAVIYCPLCDSVSVVDRCLGDQTYKFGISGLLINSNVLLYDRTDQTLWSQVALTAISGPNAGKSLKHRSGWAAQLMTFGEFKREHPGPTVISNNTGHDRDYQRNPYLPYFMTERLQFPAGPLSHRLPNKTPIVGVKVGEVARAYPIKAIEAAADGMVRDTLGNAVIKLRADPTTDKIDIRSLPEGAMAVHTFWFAWDAFHPQTNIYGQALQHATQSANWPPSARAEGLAIKATSIAETPSCQGRCACPVAPQGSDNSVNMAASRTSCFGPERHGKPNRCRSSRTSGANTPRPWGTWRSKTRWPT